MMYSGYHDAAILVEELNGDQRFAAIDKSLLPLEFMPFCDIVTNPWRKGGLVEKDFVTIAEFSELEGPKPLITIPKEENSNFDLNAFVLKIMSVDHQSVSSEKFAMPEDTQVVISEDKQCIYAYVHHFTLHDSQARGFVRPFCMAYVSTDSRKIMTFYEEMLAQFMKVSWYFKYGNLKLFHRDMKHYQADLLYTLSQLKARRNLPFAFTGLSKSKVKDELDGCSIGQIQVVLNEINEIITEVESFLNDHHLDQKFQAMEEKNRKQCSQNANTCSKDHQYHESISFDDSSPPKKQNVSMGPRRRSASSINEQEIGELTMEDDFDKYQPKIVQTDCRRFDKTLRTLHELSLWGAKEGISRLRTIHKYFSRDTAVLQIERKDSELLERPSCLLTIGHCVAVNFLHNIDLACVNARWKSAKEQTSRSHPSCSNLLKRWLSTDTLESFKSAESFFSVNDDSCMFQPAYVLGAAYVDEHRIPPRQDDANNLDVIMTPTSDDSDIFHEASSSFDLDDTMLSMNQEENEALTNTCSVNDNSDPHSSSSESSPKKVKVPVVCAADYVCSLTANSIGYGILKFVQTHSHTSNVITSVMSGRPLVIIGRSDQEVRAVVTAFAVFMPGHSSYHQLAVINATRPLRIPDLVKHKILGLVITENQRKRTHEYLVPDSVKRYVSVIDLEKGIIQAPEYTGQVVKLIVRKCKNFPSEEAYVAFIESVLLELASKAFIFYHTYVIYKGTNDSALTGGQTYERSRELAQPSSTMFSTIGIHRGDWSIIQYFAEVIKQQQTDEYYGKEFGLVDRPVPPLKLNFHRLSTYKM
ncbi:guanine nucleotide exchange protein smcr8a-like [Tubulanus polymorphus]|uniref:guanine nucleotide exchange protein smcr8a-like n=1 Tax=Tubulanus polymorphus TaxID=672921 RepID=UPI003DA48F3D